MPSPYQSPTRPLPTEIRLDNGSRLAGNIFLHPNTLALGGYVSPPDLMNGVEAFFPLCVEGAGVVLVGKARCVSVSYDMAHHPMDEASEGRDRITLEVLLSDGRTLKGHAMVDMPSAYPRALDLVNGAGEFVPVTDDSRVHLVNRGHIRTVHPLD